MGYDTTLMIGQKSKMGKFPTYLIEIARIDLCVLGYNAPLYNVPKGELIEVFYNDGDKVTSKDSYGQDLTDRDLLLTLKALKKQYRSSKYPRLKWAIDLIESILDTWKDDMRLEKVVCVYYHH